MDTKCFLKNNTEDNGKGKKTHASLKFFWDGETGF